MKLKKQVTVCGAAIFCVAVFSLYLMLDRVQHDPARHQSGGNFPRVSHAQRLIVFIYNPSGIRFAPQLKSHVSSGQEHSCPIGGFF